MEESEFSLYIPVKIRRRKEIVDGYGKVELIVTIIWFFIGLGIGIILNIIFDQLLLVIAIPSLTASGAFIFTRKDTTNRSTVDYVRDLYKFEKSIKRYDYKYHNIYEKEVRKKREREE